MLSQASEDEEESVTDDQIYAKRKEIDRVGKQLDDVIQGID